jgi:hypothetical protein
MFLACKVESIGMPTRMQFGFTGLPQFMIDAIKSSHESQCNYSLQKSLFQNTKENFGGKKFTWQRSEVHYENVVYAASFCQSVSIFVCE